MDPMTLWFVIGGLVLAAFVLTGFIAVRRRAAVRGRNARELGPTRPVPGAAGQDTGDDGRTSVDVAEPAVSESPEVVEAELVEPRPRRPSRRPRPPASRLARLRRRLAGSKSALSRGLLLLITRDQLDEETWDDFEDTLITVRPRRRPDHRAGRVRCARGSGSRASPMPRRPRRSCGEELFELVDPTMDRTLADRPRPSKPAVVMVVGRQRHRQDHHGRQAGPGAGGRGQGRAARRGRHLPRRGRRPAGDLGRPGRRADRARAPREPTRPASRSRRCGPASSRRSTSC